MGCGKSATGQKLAKTLGWPFTDLDQNIERKAGKSIPVIFSERGEAYFRELERAELESVSKTNRGVVATGGGTPCFFDNMDCMNRTGLTVYMELPVSELAGRLASSSKVRPVLLSLSGDELHHYIEELFTAREPFYCRATHIVDGNISLARLIQVTGLESVVPGKG